MATSIVKMLRVVADPNRLRILLLLKAEELSVAELQEILVMGQSTISTHLSQLKQAGLVEDRRIGKNNLYRLAATPGGSGTEDVLYQGTTSGESESSMYQGTTSVVPKGSDVEDGASAPAQRNTFLDDLLARASAEIPEAAHDRATARRVVKKRQDKMRAFFDSMAGRLGKDYVPGKSWKSLAEALLRLMPPMVIADLGSGDGSFSLLLAQSAEKVIAVDSSAKMIEFAREQAQRNHMKNVDYRLGDMEELPIDGASVDLVFFSQSLHHALHPESALAEANRILKPGGRIAILDLTKHRFEEARDMYADEWLGFSEAELDAMLEHAGFGKPKTSVVYKEDNPPHFQTLLAVAQKSA
jgi:ubiquinone/menaquinone biosynthesis C-methylase UbiE/DNA-binding transcriptional ArsR family regulator